MAKISIIVPVYNVEEYLEQCIDSLLKQTMEDIEIILVDDGSRDNSGRICDRMKQKDYRINVIHQPNQGVSVARNTGIEVAKGEWITFVDGDDWVAPELCEKTVTFAEKNEADVVIFSYYSVYTNDVRPSKLTDLPEGNVTDNKDYIIKKTISQYYGGHIVNNGVSAGTTWGKLIKKSEIDKFFLRFKPGLTRAQDTVFWLRGFEYAKKITVLDMPLYYYRISNTSVCSGTKYIPNCEIPFGMLLDEYKFFIAEFSKDSEYKKAYDLRTIQVLSWHIKHKIFNEMYKETRHRKIGELKHLALSPTFKNSIGNVKIKWLPRSLMLLVLCCRTHFYYVYYVLYQIFIQNRNRTKA